MNHRVSRVDEPVVSIAVQTKLRSRQIANKNSNARLQMLVEAREVHVQLHGLPQSHFGITRIFAAYQQIQARSVLVEEIGRRMSAYVSGRTGQEYRHVAPFVPVETVSAPLFDSTACKFRGARASRGRPSIKGYVQRLSAGMCTLIQ